MTNKQTIEPDIFRVIDANLNRLREGIRVIEDILRYKENNRYFASKLKALRHRTRTEDTKKLLVYRDSVNDVLKPSTSNEKKRDDVESIIIANFKRAQESARVLEELYKLHSPSSSEEFKTIRYELYTLEREILLEQ